MGEERLTPMMKQHRAIKERYPDAYLFFRCGDFYELFGTDAVEASSIMDITLTRRGADSMCGVPYHALDTYLARMIRAGKKVAICEQMEDPKLTKGIVKRDVVQIVSPGTVINENLIENRYGAHLVALNIQGLAVEFAYIDLSTGEFNHLEFDYTHDLGGLKSVLVRINPRELLIPEDVWQQYDIVREVFSEFEHVLVNRYPGWYFGKDEDRIHLLDHFGVSSWNDLGVAAPRTGLSTAPVILRYVEDNVKNVVAHIRRLEWSSSGATMQMDETTIKSLELVRNLQDGSPVNTLLEVLDKTVTPMGARLMRKWLLQPLIDQAAIETRLSTVTYLYHNQQLLPLLIKQLQGIKDLDRLIARVIMEKVTPRDLVSICTSLQRTSELIRLTAGHDVLVAITGGIDELPELANLIDRAIKDEPAILIHEGNIVNDGYLTELDRLKKMLRTSKEFVAGIEQKLRSDYDAPSLRIKYNKVIGYFIEISRLQSKNLDDTFLLRQSLVNNHRYTTEELSHYESEIMTAREKINAMEEEVFHQVTAEVRQAAEVISDNTLLIGMLDVYSSLADTALINHYTCPVIETTTRIEIKGGRHPVIEQKLDINQFIPNECVMDTEEDYVHIITGPNMSGKSTFLRQNALIILMAQIGSFVPADQANIGIVDRIFTRVGASDNIARGQSTFLVEMSEAANILENATSRSMIIMDEIGRGTSTYDGLAIAWAILEYITNPKFIGAKTLFATHYHELTTLDQKNGIKNLSVAVSEKGDDIIFLHKIIEKPAEKSYGIHVAKLAHLPQEVVLFAEGILKKLEDRATSSDKVAPIDTGQLQLFQFEDVQSQKKESKLLQELAWLDLNRISPLEALNILSDIQKKIKKNKK